MRHGDDSQWSAGGGARRGEARTIAVAGASGLVGTALCRELRAAGHRVRPMERRLPLSGPDAIHWDPARDLLAADAFADVDAVVNLAGENIAGGRWTAARKLRILDSRVQGTGLIAKTLATTCGRPRCLVNASAVGYYGDRGDQRLDETSPPGAGFLAETCQAWEAATVAARDAGVRVVLPRLGVVFSSSGGALSRMALPFRLGVGGRLGDGRQYLSWIVLKDLVRILRTALDDETWAGPINAVSPEAASNRRFTEILAAVLHRPALLPVPAFALRLALGEMADEMLLASARVVPAQLEHHGFSFLFPQLQPALEHALAVES